MRKPFVVYVLLIDDAHIRFNRKPLVSVHRSLQEAEEMLRAYTAELLPGWRMVDSEIVKKLAEYNDRARIFACTTECDLDQDSSELEPFTGGTKLDYDDVFRRWAPFS
jgi:hypothetical protein